VQSVLSKISKCLSGWGLYLFYISFVILGGGIGGMIAANELRARLTKEHRIVLIVSEILTTFRNG